MSQLHETYNQVKFVNLSVSSLGIFAQECSAFLDMLKNVGFDDNQRLYCVRKMITIAIRTTYYIFCCRNKEWDNPELLAFWHIWLAWRNYLHAIFFVYFVRFKYHSFDSIVSYKLPLQERFIIVCISRKKSNKVSIIIINFFLHWLF